MTRLGIIWCLSFSLLLAGCGGDLGHRETGRVSGKVRLAGTPLKDGTVIFEDSARGISGSALVKEGEFLFSQPIDLGDYKVAVRPPPLPAPHEMTSQTVISNVKIPDRYQNPDSSGFTAKVSPGSNQFEFKLD